MKNNKNAKILVVDDNNINQCIISNMLDIFGLKVDCASDGKTCLEMALKRDYDLIFMDHMMPEMDGIETYKRLKEIDNFKARVVALTANSGEEYNEFYKENGFDDYITKPIEKEAIVRIINKYLGINLTSGLDDSQIRDIKDDIHKNPKRDKLIENGFLAIDELIAVGMAVEEFEELLSIFQEESMAKIDYAEQYVYDKNMREYAVIVHGLKNDAAMISDMELSEHALNHEINSKAGNEAFVQSEWSKLKAHWQETLDRIEKYFEE